MAQGATPMMEQYRRVREELPPRTLLLFRLGDFYELFDDDAREGARVLGITLTQRHGQPMAGIPYHAAQTYLPKLLAAGWKVAICDQVETPKPGKLVQRALTRILTPGTLLDEHQQEAARNHWLLAVHPGKRQLAAAWLDLAAGEMVLAASDDPVALFPVLQALEAREVLLPDSPPPEWLAGADRHGELAENWEALTAGRPVNAVPAFQFEAGEGAQALREALGVLSLDGFGVPADHPALGPAGALLRYCAEVLCAPVARLHRVRRLANEGVLRLDLASARALEVLRSARGAREGSLLGAMDGTCSAAGARLLEAWLATPLLDLPELERRQQVVGYFVECPDRLLALRAELAETRDLARIVGRLQLRVRHPRELAAVRDTLRRLPRVRAALGAPGGPPSLAESELPPPVAALLARLETFASLESLLTETLNESLPLDVREGGVIRDGYDGELDRWRGLARGHQTWMANFEAEEQRRTGIKNLRIRYNGAFGYAIEVTKANLASVPADYVRKQTVANAERFTTAELRLREREIAHAEEASVNRERELVGQLYERVLAEAPALRETAQALAELDVLQGWAHLARDWGYCRPVLDPSRGLRIEGGRHPVIEQQLRRERHGLAGAREFVPNDVALGPEECQIALITGPNMAGKSTYIRQVALLAIMAQTGSWVPARRAELGLCDQIFARVGASDELARGQSTFMVEMTETAHILNHATDRSLVILDEIGRGTSTYDGLAIAWAVVEALHGGEAGGPRALFATHYHELTKLEGALPRLRNFHVAVKEWNDDVIFVREVRRGPADRSYGVAVARLAGLPREVLRRAERLLAQFEAGAARGGPGRPRAGGPRGDDQLGLFQG